MSETRVPPAARPWIQVIGFKFTAWTLPAVIGAAVLMQSMLVPGRELARWVIQRSSFQGLGWPFLCLAEVFQMMTGVVAVLLLRRIAPQAPAYLHWPRKVSYWWLATALGLGFACIMQVMDFWPQLILHQPWPPQHFGLTPESFAGTMVGELGAGPNEELIFRSFLLGLLTIFISGRFRAGRFEVSLAAVIVALLFGLAHYDNFFHRPLAMALGQQFYAFTFAILYAWLMERANSVVAPMLAHGLSDAADAAVTMLMAA